MNNLNYLIMANENNSEWLDRAQRFIRYAFPNWEKNSDTHLVPRVRDFDKWIDSSTDGRRGNKRSLVSLIYEFGNRNGEAMFVIYGQRVAHLLKMRECHGGLHALCSGQVLKGDHSIVVVHREYGVFLIHVKYFNKNSSSASIEENLEIRERQEQCSKILCIQRKEVVLDEMKKSMQECGITEEEVKKAFPLQQAIIVFPLLSREQEPSLQWNILYKEDVESYEAFQERWRECLTLAREKEKLPPLLYLKLLSL